MRALSLSSLFPADDLLNKKLETADSIKHLLRWYRDWVARRSSSVPAPGSPNAFLETMRRYREHGIVFLSPEKSRLYSVDSVDNSGCTVRRISGGEPKRCTAALFKTSLDQLILENGRMSFADFVDADQVTKTAYIQPKCLAISPDRKDVVRLKTPSDAISLLCDYIDRLRVDESGDSPKLYKPLILASVLKAIRSRQLTENKIRFDWAAERLIEAGTAMGAEFSRQNAADRFVRMSREPFWLLSYREPEDSLKLIERNHISPGSVEECVNYAMLREPFWEALQSAEACSRVLSHLERTRLAGESVGIDIDKELLKRAVDETIRPYLIDQGYLHDPKAEGYHHQKVIPQAPTMPYARCLEYRSSRQSQGCAQGARQSSVPV